MEAIDASLGSGDATARAQELRASLGARQDAEALLAEAGRIRQDATSAADAMVAEAQQLSEQLVAESRRAAEQVTSESRDRTDVVLARARMEAEEVAERARATADAIRSAAEADIEEHRRRVRAEVTAQVTRDLTEQHRLAEARAHDQSEALISDLDASVRILGVSLESALANVSELLGSLEALRSAAEPNDPTDPTAPRPGDGPRIEAEPRAAEEPAPQSAGQSLDPVASYAPETTSGPASSVPSATSPFGTDPDAPAADPEPPRSATEAFLSSSSMEIEQASRELRDLQNPEEARRRRSQDSRRAAQLRELEAGDPADESELDPPEGARPLGWLFRTAQ
jgi:cell division septum initiation protein DivIVA